MIYYRVYIYVYKFITHAHIYPYILTKTLMYTQISKTKLTTTIIQVTSFLPFYLKCSYYKIKIVLKNFVKMKAYEFL
jgi:hypothetical protein